MARRPTRHHYLLTCAGLMLGFGIMIGFSPPDAGAVRGEPATATLPDAAPNPATTETEKERTTVRLALPANESNGSVPGEDAPANKPPQGRWHTAVVKPGDNLSLIFSRYGISAGQLQQLVALGGDTRVLRRIFPGKRLRMQIGDGGELQQLVYDIDLTRTLRIVHTGQGFTSETITHELERRRAQASGVIEDSLFLAAQRAGLSENLIMELAGIFGWDIDFSLDIRQGDRFSVIYEELFLNGEKQRDGAILAAEFINRGKRFRALRYTDAQGHTDYYTPDGKSVRKAFLRSPVAFTRVSSRFTLARRHPVLNKIRAHKGVDYAAPRGTPVKTTGDGKIVFRGNKGGYGKTIVVQHGSRYSTLYAHLSGYARGIRPGRRVRQGQVIGYVGSTGLATGPHLHYEFRVNGVHRNPLTVRLPDASPLARRYLPDFARKTRPFLAQLDVLERSPILALSRPESAGSGKRADLALNSPQ